MGGGPIAARIGEDRGMEKYFILKDEQTQGKHATQITPKGK